VREIEGGFFPDFPAGQRRVEPARILHHGGVDIFIGDFVGKIVLDASGQGIPINVDQGHAAALDGAVQRRYGREIRERRPAPVVAGMVRRQQGESQRGISRHPFVSTGRLERADQGDDDGGGMSNAVHQVIPIHAQVPLKKSGNFLIETIPAINGYMTFTPSGSKR